jgi:hypothetical protein
MLKPPRIVHDDVDAARVTEPIDSTMRWEAP